MPIKTCPHGLVGRKKFGTDARDGLDICRRCGLPTPESVQEQQRARLEALGQHGTATTGVPAPSVEQRTLEALEAMNDRLQTVQASIVIVGVIVVLGLVLPLWFGWFLTLAD